jgi:aminoglycoside phosphotransferase family enzyme/predicted kinase
MTALDGGTMVRTVQRRDAELPVAVECEDLVRSLRNPAAYTDRASRVECIETHISWIFLTDRFAYKLKKPVRFDFLDFTTPELRRKACDDEVRLNRRLAPKVYLGVLPVVKRNGRYSISGAGPAVDWVVKMRRLPAERALDRLIQSGGVEPGGVEQIAELLSTFFTQLAPLTIRPHEFRSKLEDHLRQNRSDLLAPANGIDQAAVRRIHEAQLLMLRLLPELFDQRVLDGRIVEGHGDLRPEHIYLNTSPTVIDCVEFNPEFRQLDVLDELCFLSMECEHLNAGWIGKEILKQYQIDSGDRCPARLAAFYKCYRACVRAKVCSLRARQVEGRQRADAQQLTLRYLELADRERLGLGRPVLLIVRGLTGTGKTTLAARLAEFLEIERLETDAIRRKLFGKSKTPAEFGAAAYRAENRERVYEEMLSSAEQLIQSGRSAILDGTFLSSKSRSDALAVAARWGVVPLIVHCHCPEDVALRRISARLSAGNTLSESRPDIYQQQKVLDERDPHGAPVCRVDTTASLPAMTQAVLKRLGAEWTETR